MQETNPYGIINIVNSNTIIVHNKETTMTGIGTVEEVLKNQVLFQWGNIIPHLTQPWFIIQDPHTSKEALCHHSQKRLLF